MSAVAPGLPPPDPTMSDEEFKKTVINFLNAESAHVARSLDEFRTYMLSQLNIGSFVCACHAKHETSVQQGNKGTAKGPRMPSLLGFSPFYYYPFLFHTAFPPLPMEFLRALAAGNRILMEAIVLVDDHMDADLALGPMDLFLVDSFYQKALETLVPFLPPQSPFWKACEKLFLEYGQAVIRELTFHRYRIHPYPLDEFYSISVGKAGLIKATVLALGAFSGNRGATDKMIESQGAFLAGFQAYDDLKDWREDYARQNYTSLLTRVLLDGGFVPEIETGNSPDPEKVGRHLYFSGNAEAHLDLAEGFFRESLGSVEGLCLPLWQEVVKGFVENARAMRLDLEEIRRREASRVHAGKPRSRPPGSRAAGEALPFQETLTPGVRFLARAQESGGGFPLASSPYGYMNPYTQRGTSRAVTALILRALDPFRDTIPELGPILGNASGWLHSARKISDPALPFGLEKSFGPFTAEQLQHFDFVFQKIVQGAIPHWESVPLEGFFWVNVLYETTRQGLCLPSLERYVLTSLQAEDYRLWIYGFDPQGMGEGAARPLVLLYLFSKTLAMRPGSLLGIRKRELQDVLLVRYRTEGTWGSYTETALALTSLLSLDYEGTELWSAAERILGGQEGDGSWPSNAIYSNAEACYGSRALSSAWCVEALCLYRKNVPVPYPQDQKLLSEGCPVPAAVALHPDMPPEIETEARIVLEHLRETVPSSAPMEFFLGTWASMPPHFLLRDKGKTVIGINLDTAAFPLSTGQRPLKTEIVLAHVRAVRWQSRKACEIPLESVFVAGMALFLCRNLWPEQPPWEQSGMHPLDWQWCRGNEWYLQEIIKQSLHEDAGNKVDPLPFVHTLHTPRIMEPPAPANAGFYLGLRLVEGEKGISGNDLQGFRTLLSLSIEKILHGFQALCGQKQKKRASIL